MTKRRLQKRRKKQKRLCKVTVWKKRRKKQKGVFGGGYGMMNGEEIVRRYNSADCIYGRMYGGEYVTERMPNGEIKKVRDRVLRLDIEKDRLQLNVDKECIYFRYGGPGPDVNIYRFADYGKTWAFTAEELD